MTNKRNKAVKITTPCGVLKFPRLTEIDYGTDKYPDKAGSYRTQLILNKSDKGVTEFLAKLDELMERSKIEAEEKLSEMPIKSRNQIEAKGGLTPNLPYTELFDDETEEPTGEIELKIKRRASFENKDGTTRFAAPPPLFDNTKPPKPISKKIEVWGGTKAHINLDVANYFMNTGAYGLVLRLNAVQIVELVDSGGSRDAASYGFEGSDDGWDASSLDDASSNSDAQSTVDEVDDEADF